MHLDDGGSCGGQLLFAPSGGPAILVYDVRRVGGGRVGGLLARRHPDRLRVGAVLGEVLRVGAVVGAMGTVKKGAGNPLTVLGGSGPGVCGERRRQRTLPWVRPSLRRAMAIGTPTGRPVARAGDGGSVCVAISAVWVDASHIADALGCSMSYSE